MAPPLISIPSTSTVTPATGKPYTVYHVQLQLPLRKHETEKRYSEFLALHESLIAQTGQAPPASLPAKSWFRRTINNEGLVQERREALEYYVRAIVGADDARWRSSSAWRGFLGTSGDRVSSTANASRSGISSTALIDPNQWLEVHRELKSHIQSARQQLKQREAASTAQTQHALSAEAKASLVRAAALIAQLDDGLSSVASASRGEGTGWGSSSKLGDGEIRRRRDLIGAARKEVEGLEGVLKSLATKSATTSSSLNNTAAASEGEKNQLWSGSRTGKAAGRVLGGPLKETDRTREVDNSGVLQLQKQIMQEQDEDVLALGKTVAKLKDMGILINEELETQNEMLGLVEDDADRVQGKIDVARKRITKIS